MKKAKGRPRVTKKRMTDDLEEVPLQSDASFDIFNEMAQIDDKAHPEKLAELEKKWEESFMKDMDDNKSSGKFDYSEHQWTDDQIEKSIRKYFSSRQIDKSEQDIAEIKNDVWCRLLINADYDFMERRSYKGKKILRMVQSQLADVYKKTKTDHLLHLKKYGIDKDLEFNGIIGKSQMNNFIDAILSGKEIFEVRKPTKIKKSGNSKSVVYIDLRDLVNSGFFKMAYCTLGQDRKVVEFPKRSQNEVKLIDPSLVEEKSVKPTAEPKMIESKFPAGYFRQKPSPVNDDDDDDEIIQGPIKKRKKSKK